MERLLTLVDERKVQTVIIAKLDRLTRFVKDLAELLERFQRRGVSLVSVAESLDTGSAAGRLVINIMTAVSQWEREPIGERTRDAMSHRRNPLPREGAPFPQESLPEPDSDQGSGSRRAKSRMRRRRKNRDRCVEQAHHSGDSQYQPALLSERTR